MKGKIFHLHTEDVFGAAGAGWLSGLCMWLFSGVAEFSSLSLLFDLSDAAFVTKRLRNYTLTVNTGEIYGKE